MFYSAFGKAWCSVNGNRIRETKQNGDDRQAPCCKYVWKAWSLYSARNLINYEESVEKDEAIPRLRHEKALFPADHRKVFKVTSTLFLENPIAFIVLSSMVTLSSKDMDLKLRISFVGDILSGVGLKTRRSIEGLYRAAPEKYSTLIFALIKL